MTRRARWCRRPPVRKYRTGYLRARALRKLAAAIPGATDGLVEAVVENRDQLVGSAASYKTLHDDLMSSPHLGAEDGPLVRRFLELLHDELSRREPVMWHRPAPVPTPRAGLGSGVLGRQRELDTIFDHLERCDNVVIRGAPGIGKTTLLEALRDAYPEASYVRLEQGGLPMRDLRIALHPHVNGDFPVEDDLGIALLVRALPHGSMLFVDNADEPESASAVLRLATLLPALTVVVASRGQVFQGFRVVEVPRLPREDAMTLLHEFELPADQREVVLERGDGNPLLLRQEAWATQEGVPAADDSDRLAAVVRRFAGDEERLLRMIGELPAATLPLALLAEVAGITAAQLELLRGNAVARRVAEDSMEFHQTLRSACGVLLGTVPSAELLQLRRDVAGYYIAWLATGPSLASIDGAFPNLMHLLQRVDQAPLKVDLALALIGDRLDDPVGYLPSRGLTGLLRERRHDLREAGVAVGGTKAAQLEKNLGLFCHWGDDPAAEELVLSSRSRFRQAGDSLGEAASTWVLGIIADDSCDYLKAEALYRAPLEWLHDPAARAVGLHLVGCSLYHQSRFEEAREAFESARRETADPAVRYRSDRRIAYVELLAGDTRLAIEKLEEIKQRADRLNRPRDVARTARHIGVGWLALDNLEAAEAEFLLARDVFARVGDRRGLGATLLGLAITRRKQGRLAEARDLVQESRTIAAGGDDSPTSRMVSPIGVARAEEEEAAITEAEGKGQAVRHRRRACNIYEAIGHQRARTLADELGDARDACFPDRPAAVLFDLVDTLAETSHSAYEDSKLQISRALGVEHERFTAAWARSRGRASSDAGWSPRDRIAWVADELGVSIDAVALEALGEAERDLWSSSVSLKPQALDITRRLAAAGLPLGLVCNGTSAMRSLPDLLGLTPVFSAVVMSCEVGVLKPHTGIYQHALQALDVSHADCVYVADGNDRELEGAKAAGLFAVRMLGSKPKYSTKHSLDWDATVGSLEELAERLGV